MIGVSPSFFFSKYSTDFSVDDYIDGFKSLKNLKVDCFQGEIYKREKIDEWKVNANRLAKSYKELDLSMSLFVAHFLIHYTERMDSLFDETCFKELEEVCHIVKDNFKEVETIVVPVSKYQVTNVLDENYNVLWERVVYMFKKMANIVGDFGFNLALEIIPGSILGGIDGLLRLIEETKATNLGYNLDTGHAYCSGEILSLLPSKLNGRIFGTHLKDNFGDENLALPLGQGNINFTQLYKALQKSGYKGSFDLEIGSDRENVMMDYSVGVSYLKKNNIG